MDAQREMTLDEWVRKLPRYHLASIEYKTLKDKLDTAISALKKLRTMDTWQSVKQINDFLDETLEGVE